MIRAFDNERCEGENWEKSVGMLLKRGVREKEVGERQGANGTRSTRRDTGDNEKGITICSSASSSFPHLFYLFENNRHGFTELVSEPFLK